ncbi:DUF4825 domain-containing protein [Planococcus sp. ANT_H30]|uniref:DUF4825 domain-containing protein n=1 Tax=Planococcus sp. ANT_H30 TaxID=2597347 RepID=UPI0011F08001|nr:DUF4825 domain-containing protein [Planococcus sp. ANT_H30]KAA0956921.1 DUF4825 domain-containing protein [Planococcus sp. ANT_H30]
MNRLIKSLILLLVLTLVSDCNSDADSSNGEVFEYKDSYVGDNSAVVNTVIHLQGADYFSGIAPQTKEQPYGIVVDYDWSESTIDLQETVINNDSYLFTLIQNMDWVTFKFNTIDGLEEFNVTREEVEGWDEVTLSEIESEEKLRELIQVRLEGSEEVTEFLKKLR